MDKVDPLHQGQLHSHYVSPQTQEKKKVDRKEPVKKTFRSVLAGENGVPPELNDVAAAEDLALEDLLDEIHIVGERLSHSPTMTEVMEYKRAVKNFISHVVSRGFTLVEQEGVKFANPMKKQKKFTLVRVIDQKLEQLAAQVLQNQKSRLEILAAVNEIQGMLVDLLR